MGAIRVLLIDDQQMLTDALSAHLQQFEDLQVVGCAAADADVTFTLVHRTRPDVLLFDALQFGESAHDFMQTMRTSYPDVQLLVLTGTQSPDLILDGVRVGIAAWVPKSASSDVLLDAIRAVAAGEMWLPNNCLKHVVRGLLDDQQQARNARSRLESLSVREREVLQCLVDGMNRETVARNLYVTGNTVRTHTQRAFSKLGVHSSLEAVAVAMRAGLRPRVGQDSAEATYPRESLTQMS
jgi:DNA-binding NarL/FixJ family response regulator